MVESNNFEWLKCKRARPSKATAVGITTAMKDGSRKTTVRLYSEALARACMKVGDKVDVGVCNGVVAVTKNPDEGAFTLRSLNGNDSSARITIFPSLTGVADCDYNIDEVLITDMLFDGGHRKAIVIGGDSATVTEQASG